MSLQDLGKMVKQKYPDSYQNIDDATLGQQVLTKYPQYKSIAEQGVTPTPQPQATQQPPQEPTGISKAIMDFLTNLIGGGRAGGDTGTPEETQRLKGSVPTPVKRLGSATEVAALTTKAPAALAGVKGAGFISNLLKGLTRGTITGTEYSAGKKLQGQKDSTIEDIATFAGIEGVTGATAGLAAIEKGVGRWLTTQSELADVTKGLKISKPGQMGGTTVMNKLMDYGINGLNKAKEASLKLTGGEGTVDKMVREAAGKVKTNVSGVMDVVKNELGLDNIVKDIKKYDLSTAERKFYKDVLNAVTTKGGTLGDTKAGIEVLQSIKNFEKEAVRLGKSDSTRNLASSYRLVADELKDRLYKGLDSTGKKVLTGADDILTSGIKEKYLPEITSVSKKLADEFSKVKTIGEARSLLAPFVRASQMFDSVASAAEGGTKGLDIGKLLGGKKSVAGLAYQALNEAGVKATSSLARMTGEATSKISESPVVKTISKLIAGLIK